MNLAILYEDQDIVILDKPPGIVVNNAQSVSGPTVQSWMSERLSSSSHQITRQASSWQALVPSDFDAAFGTPEEIFAERQGMVHRLDKDTSGVLVWAKNPGALVALLRIFKDRNVQKQYLCLVHGKLAVAKDVIQIPIGRDPRFRQRYQAEISGRPAVTEYALLQSFDSLVQEKLSEILAQRGELAPETQAREIVREAKRAYQGFALVRCLPHTGRTHQIRVHMQHLNHPLVGDQLYTGRKRGRLDIRWCPRQFLHAEAVSFHHPRTQEQITATSPLAADLADTMTVLHQVV